MSALGDTPLWRRLVQAICQQVYRRLCAWASTIDTEPTEGGGTR